MTWSLIEWKTNKTAELSSFSITNLEWKYVEVFDFIFPLQIEGEDCGSYLSLG